MHDDSAFDVETKKGQLASSRFTNVGHVRNVSSSFESTNKGHARCVGSIFNSTKGTLAVLVLVLALQTKAHVSGLCGTFHSTGGA